MLLQTFKIIENSDGNVVVETFGVSNADAPPTYKELATGLAIAKMFVAHRDELAGETGAIGALNMTRNPNN